MSPYFDTFFRDTENIVAKFYRTQRARKTYQFFSDYCQSYTEARL